MDFWKKMTGGDLKEEAKNFEVRVKILPADYQEAWQAINIHLWQHSDFTGRNIMAILAGVLGLFEETAAEGKNAHDVLGDDIKGFCASLISDEGLKTYRDKWREQLNKNVARKLRK
jgi:DNA-binding ferritin-like protein (Dps family)